LKPGASAAGYSDKNARKIISAAENIFCDVILSIMTKLTLALIPSRWCVYAIV